MVELNNMRKQYPYIGNPLGFKLPVKRLAVHPLITEWKELPEDCKKVLHIIKDLVETTIGECQMYLFGSRVKGYWINSSDYDIIIQKNITQKQILEINKIKFPVKVDFKFMLRVDGFGKEAVLIK